MHLYKRINLIFLSCLSLITYITHLYLIYGIFAQPEMTLNFEKCRCSNCFKILLYIPYISLMSL